MFIEMATSWESRPVGFDSSRIECVQEGDANEESYCTVTLRSGASFTLPGRYKEVVARIHKKNEEVEKRAQG